LTYCTPPLSSSLPPLPPTGLSATPPIEGLVGAVVVVSFEDTKVEVTCPPDTNLLDVAIQSGGEDYYYYYYYYYYYSYSSYASYSYSYSD